jgi:hypothetical protein
LLNQAGVFSTDSCTTRLSIELLTLSKSTNSFAANFMQNPMQRIKIARPALLDTVKLAICKLGFKNDLSAAK